MNPRYAADHAIPRRRGMLLLLVLSMLTLFVLMGALALVIATRARSSARAFAEFNGGGSNAPLIAKSMLDEALLILIRGSKDPAVNTLLSNDNLLKDMYGTPATAGALGDNRFIDESYDAFDNNNQFMTQITLDAAGRLTDVPRPAFADRTTDNALRKVDNDGDGVMDGIWLPKVPSASGIFPPLTLANGKTRTIRVSYLVLDLDGRINVNAHGKPPMDQSLPSGGPADVDASTLFTNDVWGLILKGTGGQLLSGTPAASDQWRMPPPVALSVDGRFGGFTGKDNRGRKELTYAVRLDLEAPRPAMIASGTQNPFALGELERVLRQFDADASALPPRLAAILYDQAERARMRITTDSWTTPDWKSVNEPFDIRWETDEDSDADEKSDWAKLWPLVKAAGASDADAKQWVANLLDFRDKNTTPTAFPDGISGIEPTTLTFSIPGKWNAGVFSSCAELLAVPKGTKFDCEQKKAAVPPEPVVSLVKAYPKILDTMKVAFFNSTLTENPQREPGRVNINTCDAEVWKVVLGGAAGKPNPFSIANDGTGTPAKKISDILLRPSLVFQGDTECDVTKVDHNVAHWLANVATVRSHVFAVWITLEIKDPDELDRPTYHRLFAIVDRSIFVPFTASSEGQNASFRDIIRLRRFLN